MEFKGIYTTSAGKLFRRSHCFVPRGVYESRLGRALLPEGKTVIAKIFACGALCSIEIVFPSNFNQILQIRVTIMTQVFAHAEGARRRELFSSKYAHTLIRTFLKIQRSKFFARPLVLSNDPSANSSHSKDKV